MIITICMVNGTSDQKLLPPAIASFAGDSPRIRPKMKTMTMPTSANTSGSGNQRSLQPAMASPTRANIPSRGDANCLLSAISSEASSGGSGSHLMLHGHRGIMVGDVHLVRLADKEIGHHGAHSGHGHRVPQAGEVVAG